jgi:hypothetical protein
MQQIIIEVTEEMISEIKKKQRNEEWYNDEYSEAIRKKIAAGQTVISRGMRRDPKIPGIVKKIYLKYSYKFETLVPSEYSPVTECSDPSAAPSAGSIV